MQKEVLEQHANANVRVYAVWFSMLPTDGRSMWRWGGSTLTDGRVSHFWDADKTVGRWFAHQRPEDADKGIIWDAYFLFGPEAQWDAEPAPLISSGSTVRESFNELNRMVTPILSANTLQTK